VVTFQLQESAVSIEPTVTQAPTAAIVKRRPPGPAALPLLGNILQMRAGEQAVAYFQKLCQQYGDVVFLRIGPLPCFVLAHPDQIHQVLVRNQSRYIKGMGYDGLRLVLGQGLVTSEGELWRQQRRLMQPSFTPRAVTQFFDMMVEVIQSMLARWEGLAAASRIVAMDEEMMNLTMSVIGRAMFQVDLGQERTDLGAAFRQAFTFISRRGVSSLPLPLALPLPSHRRFKRAMGVIERFMDEKIAEGRRRDGQDDLLSMLLRAQDQETGQRMTDRQLRDEAVTLFFAGFETTARTLAWTFYLLARHPEIWRKLTAEVDGRLAGRRPQLADLMQLPYTRQIIDETLRLYPPTALLARQVAEADVIDGYPVPARALIILVPYLAHRQPDLWPEPERFDPDRFAPELVAARPRQAYLPFASGPRICIGNNFSLLEMNLALAMVATRFEPALVDPAPIEMLFAGTSRPARPIEMKLRRRSV
jgi:cytochrome P450